MQERQLYIVWKVINYSLTNAIVLDPKCHIYVQYSTHTLSLLCGATYNDNYRRVNSCFSFAVDNIYVTFNVDDLKQENLQHRVIYTHYVEGKEYCYSVFYVEAARSISTV